MGVVARAPWPNGCVACDLTALTCALRCTPPPLCHHRQVYFPYLLMNKKRYAGLLWSKPDKWDKMDSKVAGVVCVCGGGGGRAVAGQGKRG
jgi:hypothetical protein